MYSDHLFVFHISGCARSSHQSSHSSDESVWLDAGTCMAGLPALQLWECVCVCVRGGGRGGGGIVSSVPAKGTLEHQRRGSVILTPLTAFLPAFPTVLTQPHSRLRR